MYKSIRNAAFVIGAVAASAPSAQAQATLNVDVDFEFPSLIILRCFDNLLIQLDGDELLTAAGLSGTPSSVTGGTLSTSSGANSFATGGITVPTGTFDDIDVTIEGVCAVRAIGTGPEAGVDLIQNDTELAAGGGGTGIIGINSIGGRDGGGSVGAGGGSFAATSGTGIGGQAEFNINTSGGFSSLRYIDVQFNLDLTGAVDGGPGNIYESAGDTFTIPVAAD